MDFIRKHRDFAVYCLFGFLASLINIVIFDMAHNNFGIPLWIANTIAWFVSNVFSFFVTKIFVFKRKMGNVKKMFQEGIYFILSRLFSLLFDDFFMIVAVMVLPFGNIIIKVIDQLVVGLFNYYSSKLIFNYNNRNLIDKFKKFRSSSKSNNDKEKSEAKEI
ncbi:GtrA family protein [Companilactobacillus hulinensis]|uniref:GtrA family protein n=1 Tax=Companilactobacillus hulinensis TaxID=2486007 RepID=UPI000F79C156|nr:GtrA family protein [Companilactobacillus hulinensis]